MYNLEFLVNKRRRQKPKNYPNKSRSPLRLIENDSLFLLDIFCPLPYNESN